MLLYVALGSAIGGVARYLLGGLAQRMFETSFPIGTLFINISGSFLLGAIVWEKFNPSSPSWIT
jgi:CrcB protein